MIVYSTRMPTLETGGGCIYLSQGIPPRHPPFINIILPVKLRLKLIFIRSHHR